MGMKVDIQSLTNSLAIDINVIIVLFWSMTLGCIIGLERQWRQRLAGVRTNALVSVGAAMFTLFAVMLPNPGIDSVARVAAQVVSGIGFLGAGVIMRDGFNVHGLTTAATLWCSAAVGVLVGAGLIPVAILASFFILFVNLMLRPVSHAIDAKTKRDEPLKQIATINITAKESGLADIRRSLKNLTHDANLKWVSWTCKSGEDNLIVITLRLTGFTLEEFEGNDLMHVIADIDSVVDSSIKIS